MKRDQDNKVTTENEKRSFGSFTIEQRKDQDGESTKDYAEGYAAVFNSRADLGWFEEEIAPGAFDEVLNDDVRALVNHDPNLILARSINGTGTLELFVDSKGLGYRFEIPDTTTGKDLKVNMELKNISQSSFSFQVKEDEWIYAKDNNGKDLRRITKFSRLLDVAPVTYPAYLDTSVAKRSRQEAVKEIEVTTEDTMDGYEARFKILTLKQRS